MADKVVVLGGGIGGLSAATHLARRGFDVRVIEASKVAGGKARSYPAAGTATGDRPGLPAEHGFRHVANFYRHLPDTLSLIPCGDEQFVSDRLVTTDRSSLVQLKVPGQPMPDPAVDPLPVLDSFPSNLGDLVAVITDLTTHLGLWPGEAERFAKCLWQVSTSCKARRQHQLDQTSWAEFIGAGPGDDCSEAYSTYIEKGLSGALVAAQADDASACTIGEIVVWLMAGTADRKTPDRVLDGPTSDRMIDPWLGYTQMLGVNWSFETAVTALDFDGERITNVTVEGPNGTEVLSPDFVVCSLPPDRLAPLITPAMAEADRGLAFLKRTLAPDDMRWMNGLQFYLSKDVPITSGYVLIAGSPWAVTVFSEPQFWSLDLEDYGSGEIRGLLSAIISDWDTPGVYTGKRARDCTEEEIFDEVFQQLMYSINTNGKTVLTEDLVLHRTLDADLTAIPPAPDGTRWKNTVPLWINVPGHLLQRPHPVTAIDNFFLAADHPQCNTNFASMEAADECARRATNGILVASGSTEPECELWSMAMPAAFARQREEDQTRWDAGEPWIGADIGVNPYEQITLPAADAVQEDHLIQWWYWVAHLKTADGRRFGCEIVFFAIDMEAFVPGMEVLGLFKRADLWPRMAQVGVSDLQKMKHYDQQILDFGEPESKDPAHAFHLTTHTGEIRAAGGGGDDHLHGSVDGYVVDLHVEATAEPVLHYGGHKNDYRFGGYTYYYSRESMVAKGTVRTPDGAVVDVTGDVWFDRQYGALVQAVLHGWQWFALQLDDGTRIMLFAFNGQPGDWTGSVTTPAGETTQLDPGDFQVDVLAHWRSRRTLIKYPAKWRLTIGERVLLVEPLLADQEMARSLLWVGPRFWEGACTVTGTSTGQAYVELNGFSIFS